MRLTPIALLLLILLLAACGGDGDTDESSDDTAANTDGAVTAVEDFLQARVSADEDAMFESACADEEANLPMYAQSFASVTNVRIEDMACAVASVEGDSGIVTCDGRIMADYGAGEENEFPLETYSVVREGGDWKWCGETAAPEDAG